MIATINWNIKNFCQISAYPRYADSIDVWALLLTKAVDVEINPGPKQTSVDLRYVRKQISIKCNIIEHWVHLRCAGIRQAQYTDTWTCHLHRESRLTTHTDIAPPHPSRHWSKPYPLPTYTTHTSATKTQTHVQHSPCSTHHDITTSISHSSIAVNLAPSHSLSIHTCNTNNSTRIRVTATTAFTYGTTSTSQAGQIQPHDYRYTTRTQTQQQMWDKYNHTAVQHKRNQKQTRGAQTAYSRHTCIYHQNSGN